MTTTADELREEVRRRYAESALRVSGESEGCGCGSGSCCVDGESDAAKFGEALYDAEQRGRVGVSDVVAEDHLTSEERAARGSYVGCIAGALSKGEYEAGLEAAGFENIEVTFTHQVADGMHGAIIKAMKTREPEKKGLP